MKKSLCGIAFLMCLFFLATSASADFMVPDNSPYTNPQLLPNSNPDTEGAWLDHLLGFHVDYITKDEIDNPADNYSGAWTYAVLKYGVGALAIPADHFAIGNDGGPGLDLNSVGLTTHALSHITYFGPTSVPEPASMVLLGIGLFGLAAFGRKKFK
jgi:hypothetical protein